LNHRIPAPLAVKASYGLDSDSKGDTRSVIAGFFISSCALSYVLSYAHASFRAFHAFFLHAFLRNGAFSCVPFISFLYFSF
jgi:hypothetical protein